MTTASATAIAHPQQRALDALRAAWRNDRLAHAYALIGPPGIGKLRLARLFSAMLLSGEADAEAAAQHPIGRRVMEGTHPDVLLAEPPAGKRMLPIDTVRDLCHQLYLKPYEATRKLAIVREADQLNPEAANAFLKTLEEPPPGALIFLLVHEWSRMLPTIQSRVLGVRLRPLSGAPLLEAARAFEAEDAEAQGRKEANDRALAGRRTIAGKSKRGATSKEANAGAGSGTHAASDARSLDVLLAVAQGSPGLVRSLRADNFPACRAIVREALTSGRGGRSPTDLAEALTKATELPGDQTLEPQRQRLKRVGQLAAAWCRDAALARGEKAEAGATKSPASSSDTGAGPGSGDGPSATATASDDGATARDGGSAAGSRDGGSVSRVGALDPSGDTPAGAFAPRLSAVALLEAAGGFLDMVEMLERNVNSKLWALVLCSRLAGMRT